MSNTASRIALAVAIAIITPPVLAQAHGLSAATHTDLSANIVPALNVSIAKVAPALWASTGTELQGEAPPVVLTANVPFVLTQTSIVTGPQGAFDEPGLAGGDAPQNVSVSLVDNPLAGRVSADATPSNGREFRSLVSQIIDGGLPSVVDLEGWNIVVEYTFVPARV